MFNKAFGSCLSKTSIHSYLSNHKLHSGSRFTGEQRQFLLDHSHLVKYKDIAIAFNEKFGTIKTASSMSAYFWKHHLSNGVPSRIQKGQRIGVAHEYIKGERHPENEIKKGQRIGIATEFKPGQMPHNTDSVGAEITREDGYRYRKIAETKPSRFGWKQVHHLIWEEVNGQIPAGHKLLFADGDRTHLELSNLILITDAQMAIMNKNHLTGVDPDLTKAGLLIATIMSTTSKKSKELNEGR
ncbi:MAG: hypothetical protein A2Y16_05510 [Tenericutes bacterium GWF2_57_13]|nr:MAG: hypothetical protein A2Y16_05510 [Tenericutes bacterium GWF2_57_13]